MNNWAPSPRYMIAEGDTYQKYPSDETYPQLAVNYVRLDRVPKFDEDSNSISRAMQGGDFFVTTGEVLFRKWGVEGSALHRVYTADAEWTFPLEFVELVWGDGKTIGRQTISATGMSLSAIISSAFPFMEQAKSGCALRFGTRLVTGPSLNRFT